MKIYERRLVYICEMKVGHDWIEIGRKFDSEAAAKQYLKSKFPFSIGSGETVRIRKEYVRITETK